MADTTKWARDAQRWFKLAERTTQVLFHARGGGRLDWGLAAMGVAGMALEHLVGDDKTAEELLIAKGFEPERSPLGQSLCDLLRDHPRTARHTHRDETVYLWHDARGVAFGGAYYRDAEWQDGPFLGSGGREAFGEVVREVAWARGPHLRLATTAHRHHFLGESVRLALDVLPPPGPYIGRDGPRVYADRLRRYGPGPRTVLFRGPSGVGKSVLARHVATELAGAEARVLQIPATASLEVPAKHFLDLVATLKPRVLLLDDLDVRSDLDGWLALLEALRDPDVLTIATQMTDSTDDGPGAWHAPGMRPGRIDEVFALGLPDEATRRAILAHYAARLDGLREADLAAMAAASEGLTGAWLGELIRRAEAHGVEGWEQELVAIRRCTPAPPGPDAPF